ncbi:MAG: hypothetical protein H7339_10000 [Arcicella sp.]|nr:hypothetical protein [Arcicella sp.]
MRVFDKTCPVCQIAFEAKRRNQLYCSPECRADINNDKLKAKFNNIRTLEKQKSVGDKYKAAYLSAIRIVEIDFDTKDKNDIITFENRKFEKVASDMEIVQEIGLYMVAKSVRDNKRTAIFFPQEGLLCFLRSYSSYSSNGVTYQIMKKKKVETP